MGRNFAPRPNMGRNLGFFGFDGYPVKNRFSTPASRISLPYLSRRLDFALFQFLCHSPVVLFAPRPAISTPARPMRITSDAMLVLGGWESPVGQNGCRIADIALEYCRQLVTMDENVAATLEEMGALTFGLENLLAELADTHEGYVYLLQQRSK